MKGKGGTGVATLLSPVSLYVNICRSVMNADPNDSDSLLELNDFMPYLRQSLSCLVCAKLIQNPMRPPHNHCRHIVCKRCIGGRMRLKPKCSWCRDQSVFIKDAQLRSLVNCYVLMCEYVNSCLAEPLRSASQKRLQESGGVRLAPVAPLTSTDVVDMVQEGVEFERFNDEDDDDAGEDDDDDDGSEDDDDDDDATEVGDFEEAMLESDGDEDFGGWPDDALDGEPRGWKYLDLDAEASPETPDAAVEKDPGLGLEITAVKRERTDDEKPANFPPPSTPEIPPAADVVSPPGRAALDGATPETESAALCLATVKVSFDADDVQSSNDEFHDAVEAVEEVEEAAATAAAAVAAGDLPGLENSEIEHVSKEEPAVFDFIDSEIVNMMVKTSPDTDCFLTSTADAVSAVTTLGSTVTVAASPDISSSPPPAALFNLAPDLCHQNFAALPATSSAVPAVVSNAGPKTFAGKRKSCLAPESPRSSSNKISGAQKIQLLTFDGATAAAVSSSDGTASSSMPTTAPLDIMKHGKLKRVIARVGVSEKQTRSYVPVPSHPSLPHSTTVQRFVENPKIVKPQSRGRAKEFRKGGCRCGMATQTPGQLTCCGQRCPCYVGGERCVGCRCRGCRNPYDEHGNKRELSIQDILRSAASTDAVPTKALVVQKPAGKRTTIYNLGKDTWKVKPM